MCSVCVYVCMLVRCVYMCMCVCCVCVGVCGWVCVMGGLRGRVRFRANVCECV